MPGPSRTAGSPATQFWLRKRVLLTGGAGFVGSAVREALLQRGIPLAAISVPRSRSLDLRVLENCRQAVKGHDIVLHLAARTGGIAFTRAHPASQYRDCSLINLNMLEAAREAGIQKFITAGNLLAYPASAQSPLMEEALHDGPVAATHLGLGLAKRDLVMLTEMYHREYGLDAVCILGANAYGPGDRFDPEHAHVIPATIMKCFRDEDLVVWGDGTPTRDFLYVDDLADGILLAAERLHAPDCVNVASGREISIGDLVRMIAGLCGFRRRIVFDPSKGGGDPRRVASTNAASQLLGFLPKVPLEEGLGRAISWYKKQSGMAA